MGGGGGGSDGESGVEVEVRNMLGRKDMERGGKATEGQGL
jgi:hypothetical protein